MTNSEQQDYAQVALKFEQLALNRYEIVICRRGDMVDVRCNTVKVRSGVGVSLGEALAEFIMNMKLAGWPV